MAEGFLRSLGGKHIEAHSAGIAPSGLNTRAVAAMAEIGIDISNNTSKALDGFLDRKFDYIITVCDHAAANCPVFPGGGLRLHWPFDDPAEFDGSDAEIMAGFRRVRDEIKAQVEQWLDELA
jgi:arsenate reductase